METIVAEKPRTMKNQLLDIALDVSWAKVSQNYFGKSAGWLYHKLDGRDSHGNYLEFTDEEKLQLREALLDLSGRIAIAAKRIK